MDKNKELGRELGEPDKIIFSSIQGDPGDIADGEQITYTAATISQVTAVVLDGGPIASKLEIQEARDYLEESGYSDPEALIRAINEYAETKKEAHYPGITVSITRLKNPLWNGSALVRDVEKALEFIGEL